MNQREMIAQTSQNPFLSSNYLEDLQVQESFLTPQNSNSQDNYSIQIKYLKYILVFIYNHMPKNYSTQNELLLKNLLNFYNTSNKSSSVVNLNTNNDSEDKNEGDNTTNKVTFTNMDKMLRVINGESRISLRIIDWFATNYAKKYYTVYQIQDSDGRLKCIMIIS